MKILISTLMAVGLVLAVGAVYADESMPIAEHMNIERGLLPLGNGVTYTEVFDTGIQCLSEGGAAGGGMAAEDTAQPLKKIGDVVTYNGVSFSGKAGVSCSWARGLDKEIAINNGVSFPGR